MFQVNKGSSRDFWNSLKLPWHHNCADLPVECWATCVTELDGKVYATVLDSTGGYVDPLMYDYSKDRWFVLPPLPYARFSLVALPDRKQLLAIGGMTNKNAIFQVTNKVFVWDEHYRRWSTPYPNMPTA